MPRSARLIIADDHKLVAGALRSSLGEHYRVVGVAYSAEQLLKMLARRRADVLLLDIGLPDRNGVDLLPEIRRRWSTLRVVMLTMYDDEALCLAAQKAGAAGFVLKDSTLAELLAALETVLDGDTYVSRSIEARVGQLPGADDRYPGLTRLTPRQWEVLRLLGAGQTTLQIARALNLSHQMVSLHRHNLRRKLGITSEAGLLQCAMLVSLKERSVS
jgi:DNA-binding NarL/FixJ family response regulator